MEKNGLKLDEVTPTYLPPANAWAAFENGSVDAIWDPFLTAAIAKTGAKIVQDGENVIANREFFLADRNFAQAHQDILLSLRGAIDRSAAWTATKPDEIVRYLAPQLGMSEEVINTVIRRQPWGFQPISDQVVSDQQAIFARFDSEGQKRMTQLHGGRRDRLEISPNLWAGVGLVRGGAGTALVGDPETVAARLREYAALGIDTFILSGYPHLEEAYRVAELLFPLLPVDHASRQKAASYVGPFGDLKPAR